MKSYLVTHASYITDKDNYTDLQVLRSGGGYYVGTLYRTDEGWDEPGSRDSDYFATKDDATTELERLLAGGTPHTKMTHSKHNETTRWLDTLKPGDEVCIAGGWNPFIARVGRRTPTQILVEGERYRASDGHQIGGRGMIHPVTLDVRNEIEGRRLVNQLQQVQWSAMPLWKCRRIMSIVNRT